MVITGTSSGIGRATALRLDRAGFDVFAGVRKPEDGERLAAEASDRLRPVIVDVTDDAAIAAAARSVDEAVGEAGVAGLVNNAGLSVAGPLEFLPLDELRRQLEVNLVGQVAVTQAFLAAIRRARGRIVNITSVGGRIVNPFVAPYHASKWGLEAVTDALRMELRPWGIQVVAIEPGTIDTEIWRKGQDQGQEIFEGLPARGQELYGEILPKMRSTLARLDRLAQPADRVAKVVERALTARRPRARYVVGSDARLLITLRQVLPSRALDALQARALGL